MSDGSYADIIIIALIAGFILLRLRSVLGQKNDNDGQNLFRPQSSAAKPIIPDPVILPGEKSAKARGLEPDPYATTLSDGGIVAAISAIKGKDASFTATAFVEGAKMAYEMVFDAFAKGDKQTLNMLLSDAIAAHFIADIDAREKQEIKSETTLLAVSSKNITAATLEKNTARITVHFESEQVTVERNAENAIVGGDPSASHHAQDEWVFERDITSKNPNWKIIET